MPRLHVRDAGTGTPLVLLHAFPVDSRLYAAQLEEGFPGYRILAPDLPGFGRTPPDDVRTMDGYAEAVLECLDGDDFVLGGTSMGGYVAFALLRLAAERLRGLVLVDTRATPDTDAGRRTRDETAALVRQRGTEVLAADLVPRLLAPGTLEHRPQVVDAVRLMVAEAHPDGAVAALRAMRARPDSTELLGEIRVPTLVVVGAEDALTPPDEAQAMAARIDGATVEVLPGAGHLCPIEAPDAFNAALGRFLDAL